jgi:hypothetical protein
MRILADGLEGPEGIDIGKNGRIVVVEADAGRVVSIDLQTGSIEVLAEGLELHLETQGNFPVTMAFNGLAVGSESVFVTGDKTGVLYRIDLLKVPGTGVLTSSHWTTQSHKVIRGTHQPLSQCNNAKGGTHATMRRVAPMVASIAPMHPIAPIDAALTRSLPDSPAGPAGVERRF